MSTASAQVFVVPLQSKITLTKANASADDSEMCNVKGKEKREKQSSRGREDNEC